MRIFFPSIYAIITRFTASQNLTWPHLQSRDRWVAQSKDSTIIIITYDFFSNQDPEKLNNFFCLSLLNAFLKYTLALAYKTVLILQAEHK